MMPVLAGVLFIVLVLAVVLIAGVIRKYSLSDERADQMANTTVSDERLRKILDELFPEADDMSNIQKRHVQEMKDGYMVCVMAPDLAKFRNTAWGAVNAMSDFVTHSAPHRNTKNYQANNWNNVMGGHWLIDAMTKAVAR